ncbi:hypothetical protein RHGRI_031079 [Rhododendron griersonianum]|uniref:Uncharacterized protein n=1 Tax=Rhododendron griersonianum TaxID=479676 RepID=A0AAV6IC84_9ERIC|nr:hypothetical protein RHGRI_031079 [Rhododendron griersonianum]
MGTEEAPKSWYEPVRKPYFEEEAPFVGQGRENNVPKIQWAFRNGPRNDSLFESIFEGQEGEIKSKNGYYTHDEHNYAQNNGYLGEGIGMKGFKQAPEIPRHTDVPRVKRSYINLLFEPTHGGWEEEPRRTQYRNEERYVPPQNSDRYFKPQGGPSDGPYTGYPRERNLREPHWDQP